MRAFTVTCFAFHLLVLVSAHADQPPPNLLQGESAPNSARGHTPEQSEIEWHRRALQRVLESKQPAQTGGSASKVTTPQEVSDYSKVLVHHIKDGWAWEDKTAPLVTIVELKIGTDGTLGSVSVKKSSDNVEFDESVLAAVRKASPFPAPPQEYYHYFKTVRITFDPR